MRKLLTFLVLVAAVTTVRGQYRLASDGFVSVVSNPNDTVYVVDVNFFADLTGSGYSPTNLQVGYRLFSQREQLYRIDSVADETFTSARLKLVEIDNAQVDTEGAPVGQVQVFDPGTVETIPQVPFGATGAGSVIQAAVVSYNSRLPSGGISESVARTIASDSVSVERTAREALEAQSIRSDRKKANLVFVTGQSNARGRGDISLLTSDERSVTNVLIYNEGTFQNLDFGSGTENLQSDAGDHGLESVIGLLYDDFRPDTLFFAKYGVSGQPAHAMGPGGFYWENVRTELCGAVSELISQGYDPYVTVVLSQGEADSNDPDFENYYERYRQRWIRELRNIVGNARFIHLPLVETDGQDEKINNIIEKVSKDAEGSYYLTFQNYGSNDALHYNTQGWRDIASDIIPLFSNYFDRYPATACVVKTDSTAYYFDRYPADKKSYDKKVVESLAGQAYVSNGAVYIDGNGSQPGVPATTNRAYYRLAQIPASNYQKVRFSINRATNTVAGPFLRFQQGNTGESGILVRFGNSEVIIYEATNGSYANLGTTSIPPADSDDDTWNRYTVEIIADTVYVYNRTDALLRKQKINRTSGGVGFSYDYSANSFAATAVDSIEVIVDAIIDRDGSDIVSYYEEVTKDIEGRLNAVGTFNIDGGRFQLGDHDDVVRSGNAWLAMPSNVGTTYGSIGFRGNGGLVRATIGAYDDLDGDRSILMRTQGNFHYFVNGNDALFIDRIDGHVTVGSTQVGQTELDIHGRLTQRTRTDYTASATKLAAWGGTNGDILGEIDRFDMSGNEVTNAAAATASTSLTTLGQVQDSIASAKQYADENDDVIDADADPTNEIQDDAQVQMAAQKGVPGNSLRSALYHVANSRPVISNDAKAWRFRKVLTEYKRNARDTLKIALIGDSKMSDRETWQRPLYELLVGSGIQPMSYGYVSFNFQESPPWPTNRTRNMGAHEYAVGTDTLVGPDLRGVNFDGAQTYSLYTQGLPTGTGAYPWDSIVIYYYQQPGGGTFSVRDSRGNSYDTINTDGIPGLKSVGVAIRNGQDISPRCNIFHVDGSGSTKLFGYRQWNTLVPRGFILDKYGASGQDWVNWLEASEETLFGIMDDTSPDVILAAYGINHPNTELGISEFRTSSLEGTDLLRSRYANATMVYASTTYGFNNNVTPDIFANYIDSLISVDRLDAAHINLNLAYYNSSEKNKSKGVTPDGTHYEGSVGSTNADYLWSVLFPNYATNVVDDDGSGPSFQQFWGLVDGSTVNIEYKDGTVSTNGIVNSVANVAESSNIETFRSYGRATIGDQNNGNEYGILSVMGFPGNGGETATGFGVLDRKTLHLVQRGATGDGLAQALIGFSGSASGRPLAYFGSYQDGADPEYVGFAWGTHSSNSAGVDPYDAMRLTRLGQLILPRMGLETYSDNTPFKLLGIGSTGGDMVPTDPTAIFGTNDTNADGNEVTNAAAATASTSLTTLGQVQGEINASQPLTATTTLDFASISATSSADLTVTVTGAAVGDAVYLGVPHAAVEPGTLFFAWVSSTNTVTIRCFNSSGVAVDPVSADYTVKVRD